MEAIECENCGRAIGKLEIPYIYDGHTVCAECASRLTNTAAPAPPPPYVPSYAAPPPDSELQQIASAARSRRGGGKVGGSGRGRIQTIELTAKKWKGMQVLGALVILAGAVGVFVGVNSKGGEMVSIAGGVGCGVGLIIVIVAKSLAWWHHG